MIAKAMIIAVIIQFTSIVLYYLLGLAVGIKLGFYYYPVIVPIVILLTMIPISIQGLGIREISFVYLFGLFNVTNAKSFALSIIASTLFISVGLIGGIINLFQIHKED